jgi:uracil-DNA glycosylase
MESLGSLLKAISDCDACNLMADNRQLGIPYIPICPKPNAKFMFIGRDPSPRTACCVGVRGGRSVFINEPFCLADEAGIAEELIYITDMCKCHWRTSRGGTPCQGTEDRPPELPDCIAETCIQEWLFKEVDLLKPTLIIIFGEEAYKFLRNYVVYPSRPPQKLSASRDKSLQDAELWFAEEGPMKVRLGSAITKLVPLRHPGNAISLPPTDKRRQAHQRSREKAIALLRIFSGSGTCRRCSQITHL